MTRRLLTPSQTVGPFFADALLRPGAVRATLVGADTPGERIRLAGRVVDGHGVGVPDAMVEIWQADADGRYAARPATFLGFGRVGTDEAGAYGFETIRPGRVTDAGAVAQAPHVSVAIFARGLLNHLYTRVYFADDPPTEDEPVWCHVPPSRRGTLLAARGGGEPPVYTFDIVLQGADETVFFAFR
ncbi:MAG: protocatechuate 3,4-dioxygenase subunit alpha [Vicinamibacterales bacterium]